MPKKPKRLKINPEDRVIGVRPREKRDLFAGCNEPGKEWFHPDAHVFMKTFCRICKNADCVRAKGAVSPWHTRMAEQVDYLLNDPELSDLTSEAHRKIAEQAFDDIGRKMMRLEIAKQRQDWEIPDDGPTDGFDKVAAPDTTDQFDEAVKKLARARGKEEPVLPKAGDDESPAHFQQQDESEEEGPYEYDTQYPSSDGKRTYHVALDKAGKWSCECEGFRYARKCKHLDAVRAWYNEQLLKAEQEEGAQKEAEAVAKAQASAPPTQQPARDPRVPPDQAPLNTPMPQGGVMIGGGMPPNQGHDRQSPTQHDPWAIPSTKVVKPGAQVTLKSTKKKDS